MGAHAPLTLPSARCILLKWICKLLWLAYRVPLQRPLGDIGLGFRNQRLQLVGQVAAFPFLDAGYGRGLERYLLQEVRACSLQDTSAYSLRVIGIVAAGGCVVGR